MTWAQVGPWLALGGGSVLVAVLIDLTRRVGHVEVQLAALRATLAGVAAIVKGDRACSE